MSKAQLPNPGETPQRERTDTGLDEGLIHELLRNSRRRAVLRIIHQQREATAREIAEQIATEETGESPPSRDDRQSVYISLIQTHLPKLDETGTIEYDERAKRVSLGPAVDQLAAYTGDIGQSAPEDYEDDDTTKAVMLVSVVASWVLAVGATFGVPVIELLSPADWSAPPRWSAEPAVASRPTRGLPGRRRPTARRRRRLRPTARGRAGRRRRSRPTSQRWTAPGGVTDTTRPTPRRRTTPGRRRNHRRCGAGPPPRTRCRRRPP